ncbi:MAG: hypothetical protein JO017_09655 [Actinobacteria bacterium]|nr:hypothetical protein [Actinomycetota bacterium]
MRSFVCRSKEAALAALQRKVPAIAGSMPLNTFRDAFEAFPRTKGDVHHLLSTVDKADGVAEAFSSSCGAGSGEVSNS